MYEMEMPTPCPHCSEIFDLNDGYASKKWYSNETICLKCHEDEEAEIEEDEALESENCDLENALYGFKDNPSRLSEENKQTIISIASKINQLKTKRDEEENKIYMRR